MKLYKNNSTAHLPYLSHVRRLGWVFLFLIVTLFTACATSDEDVMNFEPAYNSHVQAAYQGTWVFFNDLSSSNSSSSMNHLAENSITYICQDKTFSLNFPIQAVARLAVPEERADEAAENAYCSDYSFPFNEVGYSDNMLYWQIDKPRYIFHTRYGGAVHKIAVYMSNSNAICANDYSSLSISLNIDSLQNADKTVARFQPQLGIMYIWSERIK